MTCRYAWKDIEESLLRQLIYLDSKHAMRNTVAGKLPDIMTNFPKTSFNLLSPLLCLTQLDLDVAGVGEEEMFSVLYHVPRMQDPLDGWEGHFPFFRERRMIFMSKYQIFCPPQFLDTLYEAGIGYGTIDQNIPAVWSYDQVASRPGIFRGVVPQQIHGPALIYLNRVGSIEVLIHDCRPFFPAP